MLDKQLVLTWSHQRQPFQCPLQRPMVRYKLLTSSKKRVLMFVFRSILSVLSCSFQWNISQSFPRFGVVGSGTNTAGHKVHVPKSLFVPNWPEQWLLNSNSWANCCQTEDDCKTLSFGQRTLLTLLCTTFLWWTCNFLCAYSKLTWGL